jgi:hypothetical protein
MIMDKIEDILEGELDFSEEENANVLEGQDKENPVLEKIDEEGDFFKEEGSEEGLDKNDLVIDLLKARGINGTKFTMLNEEDEEVEVDFFELPREEQIELLNAEEETAEPIKEPLEGIADSEKEFLAYLRQENISLDDYLQKYKENAISEAGISQETSYDIDAYSDNEVFLLDLKSRYEDLSDEELKKELDKALEDEEVFNKKITKTREEYKGLEDRRKADEAAEIEKNKEEQYGQFVETMVDVAVKNPEFYGIELEDDEKNEVLSYLLEVDEKGASEFSKGLNDPKKLYEAAWFMKYGKEAFDAIRNAYELETKELKKDAPPKEEKKDNTSKVVVKNKPDKQEQIKSIYDLNI